jgi:hypothetical protein
MVKWSIPTQQSQNDYFRTFDHPSGHTLVSIMSEKPKPAAESSSLPPCETAVELSEGSNDIYIDPALEKSIISKFDRYLMPTAALLVLLAYLDRSNIGMLASSRDHFRSGADPNR